MEKKLRDGGFVIGGCDEHKDIQIHRCTKR